MDPKSDVRTAIRDALDTEQHVQSCALFGSLPRGEFVEDKSDVNLLVCLDDTDPKVLLEIGETFRGLWRSHRVHPYFIKQSELPHTTDAFPIKFLDIRLCHEVLTGNVDLKNINIEDRHLRIRVEQAFRNHLVRLRWRYVHTGDDDRSLLIALRFAGRVLRHELLGLLVANGHDVTDCRTSTVFEQAAQAFDLDANVLNTLRDGDPNNVHDFARDCLLLLERCATIADKTVAF